MKIFNKISVVIIISAVIFFIVNESFTYYTALQKAKEEGFNRDKLILKNLTDAQAQNVTILAEVLSSDENVLEAYKTNNPKLIQEHIAPIWEKVKNKKLTYEIHFFKPPAISFVNFSNFKSIGHDVSDVRTDIEWITSSFKSSSHTLMCKTYAGLRATHPILDNDGNMLGGLSLGKKIDWLPQAIKEKSQHDAFLIYTKESTQTLMQKYYENFIKDKQIIGQYILADKTIAISKDVIPNIDFTKNIQELILDDQSYTLYSYPIIDFNDNVMGYVCTLTQLKKFKDRMFTHIIQDLIIVFIATFIIFFLTRRRILELLKQTNYLKDITKEIKKRNFSYLYTLPSNSNMTTDSLLQLEKNILEMGYELEQQYTNLKYENALINKKLIKQLYTDELTGLGNRNALFRDLEENKDAYVAIFNIRGFKEINDAFGFETGNSVLIELTHMHAPYIYNHGLLSYRVGSDEFVIINDKGKVLSKDEFRDFVLKMIDKIEHTVLHFNNKDIEININMYAGICLDKDRRLEKADMALTQAKKEIKECIIYSEKKNTKDVHFNNIEIINKITKAIHNDNIVVYYQAIVDKNEKINKYEALVRMIDNEKVMSPYYFLEISKKTKHYASITKIVIEKTFDKFKNSDKSYSINLTADDILNEDILDLINSKLEKCSDNTKVVFELVESDDLYHLQEITDFIKYIKSTGAKIAIDDFGTGYSNFSYMMNIKPDYLKIDGSLIKNINDDENARIIVKTIVAFAKELNIKTIAEFVHSEEVFNICKEIEVDEFQGFYFSEPQSKL